MDVARRGLLTGSVAGALLAQLKVAAAQPSAPETPRTTALQELIEAARRRSPELSGLMARHLPGLEGVMHFSSGLRLA